MSLSESMNWELINTTKFVVDIAEMKDMLKKTHNIIDKLNDKIYNIEKTQNIIINTLIEYNQQYCKNKDVYLEILNKLDDDRKQVKPLLNKLEQDNEKIKESLADPVLLTNRIYNRYWRAPFLKNANTQNILPLCNSIINNRTIDDKNLDI